MMRMPPLPLLILSFFYVYGALNVAGKVPGYGFSSPTLWTVITAGSFGLLLVAIMLAGWLVHRGEGQAVGWCFIFTLPLWIVVAICCFGLGCAALIKWFKLLFALSGGLCVFGIICYLAGISAGWGTLKMLVTRHLWTVVLDTPFCAFMCWLASYWLARG